MWMALLSARLPLVGALVPGALRPPEARPRFPRVFRRRRFQKQHLVSSYSSCSSRPIAAGAPSGMCVPLGVMRGSSAPSSPLVEFITCEHTSLESNRIDKNMRNVVQYSSISARSVIRTKRSV